MTIIVPFKLSVDGDDAAKHQPPAYDGFMSMAGFAWTLSLVAQYAETGKIRHRGDFEGRSSVKCRAIAPGSVVSEFFVTLTQNPAMLTVGGVASAVSLNMASNFLYDLLKRTIDRNVGTEINPSTEQLQSLEEVRGGDLEALVAAVEPAVRQSHMVIGNGAQVINIIWRPDQFEYIYL